MIRLQHDLPDYNLQRYHLFMEYHHAMAYANTELYSNLTKIQ